MRRFSKWNDLGDGLMEADGRHDDEIVYFTAARTVDNTKPRAYRIVWDLVCEDYDGNVIALGVICYGHRDPSRLRLLADDAIKKLEK